ncbi:TatD family hydrolase [bacterium]|nr:TatD family hydrolase [bacterium]
MKDYLIDTHAHIDMFEESVEETLNLMSEYSVKKAVIPAVEIGTQNKVAEIASNYENLYGMIGIFPSEAKTYTIEFETEMEKIAKTNKKIVAVGEIGLDYYWDKSFIELQKEVFIKQIKLANRLNLPIVVHDREAHKDCFDIIKSENINSKVLFHCFSGSVEFMEECVKEGWYIALGGVVTFKNAVKMKNVAREIPLDKLLLETDSPYLTPVPYRGKPNKPAYVKYVAEEIAKIRQISVDEIINTTTENAERFFGI